MRTTTPLTDRAVLAFLKDIHDQEGRMPAILEVARHFGHKSPTSIQRIYARLCEQRLLNKHGTKYGLSAKGIGPTGLPILGHIAAGQPIEAIENEADDYLDLAEIYDSERHFCLRVKGESMIDALIGDGDIAIIKRQQTCENGDIVAAVVDGEATLKRWCRMKDHILLKPANVNFQPIKVCDVEIRGVLVGVLRKYAR